MPGRTRTLAQANKVPPLDRLVRIRPRGEWLSVDPGEHIGLALWHGVHLTQAAMLHEGHQENLAALDRLFVQHNFTTVIIESYHIYNSHLKQHTWSNVPTLRVIGALELLCVASQVHYYFQSAAMGKGFCTDTKLNAWGFGRFRSVHTRDAIRHGCQYMIFGAKREWPPLPSPSKVKS